MLEPKTENTLTHACALTATRVQLVPSLFQGIKSVTGSALPEFQSQEEATDQRKNPKHPQLQGQGVVRGWTLSHKKDRGCPLQAPGQVDVDALPHR